MEKLTLNPPILIMTMGYPGAGKSFFSRQFSEAFKLPIVSEDRLRYDLFENPQFNDDESEIITRMLTYTVSQIMKTGTSLLCDGDFSTKSARQQLYDLAKENGYRTLIVWLQTDINTSKARALKRDRRNIDNKYNFDLSIKLFEKLTNKLSRPSDKESYIVISGKHAFKAQSLTVLRKITEHYATRLEDKGGAAKNETSKLMPRQFNRRNLIQ
jgi:predicted kinase